MRDYILKRTEAFTFADGRICLRQNAAERALRGIAMTDSFCTSFSSV
jgi:transposase